MIATLRWVWYFTLWIALFVAGSVVSNEAFGLQRPLWAAAVQGAATGGIMIVFFAIMRRGWIKGVLWNPETREKFARRRRELAEARERIVAEAKCTPKA